MIVKHLISNPKDKSAQPVQDRPFSQNKRGKKLTKEDSDLLTYMCRLVWVFTVHKSLAVLLQATLIIIVTHCFSSKSR